MRKKLIILSAACLVLSLALNASGTAGTPTGTFTGPLTGAILSVDLNGGTSSNNRTTEGWNGSAVVADPYGVTWSPWGGATNQGGDGTTLPSATGVTSIAKTFGAITLTVSAPGTSSNYSSGILNSRDRGSSPSPATDNDVFRDFLFVGGSYRQGANYMQVEASGLTPGWSYEIALFSYDSSSTSLFTNWTDTAPYNISTGYYNGSAFVAPADEKTISFSSKGAPAVFTLTANSSGKIDVWGWGGTGNNNDNNAAATYLDGIQIVQVTPEPATMALLGLGGLALIRRKR